MVFHSSYLRVQVNLHSRGCWSQNSLKLNLDKEALFLRASSYPELVV